MAQTRKKLFKSFEEMNKNTFYFNPEWLLHKANQDKNSALKISDAVHVITHFVGIRFIKIKNIWNVVTGSGKVYPTEEMTFRLANNNN